MQSDPQRCRGSSTHSLKPHAGKKNGSWPAGLILYLGVEKHPMERVVVLRSRFDWGKWLRLGLNLGGQLDD